MRAGGCAPAFGGLGAFSTPVASPTVLVSRWSPAAVDDAPCVSPALQPSARCVLPSVVRARFSAPCAPAFISDNSKSTFKIYPAILYRRIDDFDFDFKLSNAGRLLISSGRTAPLPHPPPEYFRPLLWRGAVCPPPPSPRVFFMVMVYGAFAPTPK